MCNKKGVREHSPEKKNLSYKSVEKSPRALLREILERYRWDIQICYIDRRFFNHTLVHCSTKKKKKVSHSTFAAPVSFSPTLITLLDQRNSTGWDETI